MDALAVGGVTRFADIDAVTIDGFKTLVEQRGDVVGAVLQAERPVCLDAAAVATVIECDDAVALFERGDRGRPVQ